MTEALIEESAAEGGVRTIDTPHLGPVAWDSASELFLPAGLPGFEDEKRFVPVEIPAHRPLVFLQSAGRPEICFVCLPANTISGGFEPRLSEDDRAALLIGEAERPEIGVDILCLVLLLPCGSTVRANLGAPIIINLHNSRCAQCLAPDGPTVYYRLGESGAWEASC